MSVRNEFIAICCFEKEKVNRLFNQLKFLRIILGVFFFAVHFPCIFVISAYMQNGW